LAGPYKPNPATVGIDPAISFLSAVTGEIGKFDKSQYILDN
jgi:protein TIF31